MLGTILDRTYGALCNKLTRTVSFRAKSRGGAARHLAELPAGIDVAALEDRILLSATPFVVDANVDGDAASTGADDATPPAELWLFAEDYDDGQADRHTPRSGTGAAVDGHFVVSGTGNNITTVDLDTPLSDNLEMSVSLNMQPSSGGSFSNAFVIFDYQSATNFKFAGAYAGSDRWVIGHFALGNWTADTFVNVPVDPATDYDVRIVVTGGTTVTLYTDGGPRLAHTYGSSVTDGQLGLATLNGTGHFDNLQVRALSVDAGGSAGVAPVVEDFNDGLAEHLQPQAGTWVLRDGAYTVYPVLGSQGVSTLILQNNVPEAFQLDVTFQTERPVPDRYGNGLIIFDYQSATDFKYAGGFLGSDLWVIGERTSAGWNDLAVMDTPLDDALAHSIRLAVDNATQVTLEVGGQAVVTHTFADSVVDGAVGLGSNNSVTHFDDVRFVDLTPPPEPEPAPLPDPEPEPEPEPVPVAHYKVERREGHLYVSGDAGGHLRIVAQSSDVFQVWENGQVLSTIDGVRGNLMLDLGDGDDHVVLDLAGHRFNKSIHMNLGEGANDFQLVDGSVKGHVSVTSGGGTDTVHLAESVVVKQNVKLQTGAGDDTLSIAATVGRGLLLNSAAGDDVVELSGKTVCGVVAHTGEGNDHFQVTASASLGLMAAIHLGAGDDTFVSDVRLCRAWIVDGRGDDSVFIAGVTHHPHHCFRHDFGSHGKSHDKDCDRDRDDPQNEQANKHASRGRDPAGSDDQRERHEKPQRHDSRGHGKRC